MKATTTPSKTALAVVTVRDTDVGALINAGSSSAPAMFVVSDLDKLRVYVNVPQSFAPAIRLGAKATVTMPEYPERSFPATVEAASQAVDVQTGTTRMQLLVGNESGLLLAGSYANVRIDLSRPVQRLHIPASALLFDQAGLRVATVVGPGEKVLMKTITIARDLGKEIEIATGLTADDRIIVTPPDGMLDGMQVRIAKQPAAVR